MKMKNGVQVRLIVNQPIIMIKLMMNSILKEEKVIFEELIIIKKHLLINKKEVFRGLIMICQTFTNLYLKVIIYFLGINFLQSLQLYMNYLEEIFIVIWKFQTLSNLKIDLYYSWNILFCNQWELPFIIVLKLL